MASSSSASLLQPVSKKLSKNNHSLWKAQVCATVRGARLQGFLSSKSKAPPTKIVVTGADGKEVKKLVKIERPWTSKS
jgi:hypothetical protein